MNKKNNLIELLKNGKLTDITKLITLNSDIDVDQIDKKGFSVLHWSIIKGHLKSVKYLIERGANYRLKTPQGLSPIELAIYTQRERIVKILFSLYTKKENSSLLHTAATLNNQKILTWLIEEDLNVNSRDVSGRTPLHWAAQEGSMKTARILLANDAEIDRMENQKFTPLAIAAGEGHFDFVKLLLKNGANVNKKISEGSALHIACAWGHVEIVKLLIKYNAKINYRNTEGQTPLHLAAMNCNREIIGFLLKEKADKEIKDFDGNTAFDLAKKCDPDIKMLL